jgi:D-inositol-3-phosphate glycosyltransferase
MKIIIISPAHPLRGGIAASSERLALELQSLGHEVVMYSFSLQYPSFLFPGKTQYTESAAPVSLNIKTTINSINPLTWLRTGWLIAKERPDLVITRYWLPFMAGAQGTILRSMQWFGAVKARRIGFVDNLIPHEKRPGDMQLSRYFARSNDAFLAMTESVAQDIRSLTKEQKSVLVSPHPLYDHYGDVQDRNMALQHLGLPTEPVWLMFFGFIRAYKGLDLLLEALALEPLKSANVRLLIAGECYEDWKPYQDLIDRGGIANRVVLRTDYISDDEVKYYFSLADLVVQPYKSATQSGITQIAMHFNKPSLVTRVGGLPEMVEHGVTGLVVEPNAQAIADAIMLYLPKAKQITFAANIELAKGKYAWKVMADKLLKIGLSS